VVKVEVDKEVLKVGITAVFKALQELGLDRSHQYCAVAMVKESMESQWGVRSMLKVYSGDKDKETGT